MTDQEKLDKAKKEIRSLLISYQNGCTLAEFNHSYRGLMGSRIPYEKFGCSSDIEFLKKLPDVVNITQTGRDYHLIGVADEKTKHIQKMVGKQKSSRKPSKISRSSIFSRTISRSNVPPRLSRNLPVFQSAVTDLNRNPSPSQEAFPRLPKYQLISLVKDASFDGVVLSDFLLKYQKKYHKSFSFKLYGYASLRSCIESIPELTLITREKDVVVYETLVAKSIARAISSKTTTVERNEPPASNTVFQYSAKGSGNSGDKVGKSIDHDKSYSQPTHSVYQFGKESNSSHDVFRSNANEKHYFNKDDDESYSQPNHSAFKFGNENNSSFDVYQCNANEKHYFDKARDNVTSINVKQDDASQKCLSNQNYSFDLMNSHEVMDKIRIVPENVKEKLRKVSKMKPQGVFAKQFPTCYEEITNTSLDLHSLGFSDLSEFIDEVPEIFVRKSLSGSKKEWVILPADSISKGPSLESSQDQVLMIELIKRNIRKILEAYPEGVKVQDFIHLYSINCNDTLCVQDLGFDNLGHFLESIATSIPLNVQSNGTIHLVPFNNFKEKSPAVHEDVSQIEAFPLDAVPPESKYTIQQLPEDLDLDKYIPVYTSSISNPGLIYLQLKYKCDDLTHLLNDVDAFYKSAQSERYIMKRVHIKLGAICAALWPSDQLWYRAQIIGISSLEFVKVIYVDYGTKDEIPIELLRYLKKEYWKFPTQALKAELAYVKPMNGRNWTKDVTRRLLILCQDIPLMAKIIKIDEDGKLTVNICDTTGDEDVFVGDVLIQENLAVPAPAEIEEPHTNNALPAQGFHTSYTGHGQGNNYAASFNSLQSQYAMQASQDNCLKLMNQLSMMNPYYLNATGNTNAQQFFPGMSINPFLVPSLMNYPNSALANPFFNGFAATTNLSNVQSMCQPNTTSHFQTPFSSTAATSSNHAENFETVSQPATASLITKNLNDNAASYSKSSSSNDDEELFEDSESDIFDDDEEMFQQICEKVETSLHVNRRYVKRLDLGDGYKIHLIVVNNKPYASGGDISSIIWVNKDCEFLNRKLQNKEANFSEIMLLEESNEELFRQMELFSVKGVQKRPELKSSVLLFPLRNIINILNLYGQPSRKVRVKLAEELHRFNPNDSLWQSSPSEPVERISSKELVGVTDDEKINQMCLYDLLAMKEGIYCRRIKLMAELRTHPAVPKIVDEIEKLDQLLGRVLERIKDIKAICAEFL